MDRASRTASLLKKVLRGGEPAERLLALVALKREVDELETEAVADALRANMSWRQIGEALGISKQAAHHRHSRSVGQLDRATAGEPRGRRVVVSPAARKAVRAARLEADALGDRIVGIEHLLLGLLQSEDQDTIQVLRRLGVSRAAVCALVEAERAARLSGE